MAKAGKEFIERWIDEHVGYAEHGANSIVALDLADKCREAATAKGITIEIEPHFGTLDEIIFEALQRPKAVISS